MDRDILHSEIYNAFLHIVQNYAVTIHGMTNSDNKMLANLINDLIVHSVKEKNIAMIAANAGVLTELSQIAAMDQYEQNLQFSKLHKKMVNNYGLEADSCEMVLGIFVYALGVTTVRPISDIDKYLEELNRLPVEERKCITCISSQIPGLYISGKTGDDVLEKCIRGTRQYNLKWEIPVKKRIDEETLELSLYNRINERGVIVKINVHHVGEGKGKITTEVFKQHKTDTGFMSVGTAKEVRVLLEEIAKNQSDNDIRKIYISFLKKCRRMEVEKQAEEMNSLREMIKEKNEKYVKSEPDIEYTDKEFSEITISKKLPTIKELNAMASGEEQDWYLIDVDEPIGVYKEKSKTYETLVGGMFVRIKVIEMADKYGGIKIRYVSFWNPMYGFTEEERCAYGEFPKLSSLLLKKAVKISNRKKTKEETSFYKDTPVEIVTTAYSPSELFRANNCYIIDKRYADGCLWVMGDLHVLRKCSEIVEQKWGIKGHFGSGKVSHNKKAWFTKDERYDEVEALGAEIRRKKEEEQRDKEMETLTFTRKDILNRDKTKYYPVVDLFYAFWNDKECFERILRRHNVEQSVIELLNEVSLMENDYLQAKVIVAAKTKTQLVEKDLEDAVYKKIVSVSEKEISTEFWWEKTFLVTAKYKGVVVGTYTRKAKK